MNLLTIIFVTLLLFSLTDFMWPGQKKLHKQLYYIALFVTYFLFTIKYYYGPDILTYVPVYENIEKPSYLLQHGSRYNNIFEFGYLFFCSILRHIGVSFWLMTAIVSTFYFYAIYKLFERIPNKRTFALFILVLLDSNLIFAEFRQCMAVSFYIFMILAILDKKHIPAILYFIFVASLHKSGLYIGTLTLFTIILFGNTRGSAANYWLLGGVLLLFCFISTKEIILSVLSRFSISHSVSNSIIHHLQLERKIQVIFILYFIAIFIISLNMDKIRSYPMKKLQWVVFAGFVVVVLLFQYYYLLNRIRSYFLPFFLLFIFRLTSAEQFQKIKVKNFRLLNQLSVVMVYLILSRNIVVGNIEQSKLESKIYVASTIFERSNKSEAEIKKRQLDKAKLYWERDFKKHFQQ